MYEQDRTSQFLGHRPHAIRPGYARMTMHVTMDMVNGHAICHGGYIFTLADTAFAYACNSHNHNTVAAGGGDRVPGAGAHGRLLTARRGRLVHGCSHGVYDVDVTQPGRRAGRRCSAATSHRIAG